MTQDAVRTVQGHPATDTDPSPGPGTRATRPRIDASRALPVLGVVTFLGLWELVTRTGVFPEAIPPLTEIVSWLAVEMRTGPFWGSVGATIAQWGLGLALSFVVGVPVGVAMGAIPLFRRLFEVPFEFLRPIPSIIYLPLVVLVLGSGAETAVLLALGGAVWPLLFNTYYGVADIDPVVQDTGRAFGLNRRQRLAYILVPSILPYLATGFRIAASMALVIVVSVGLITGVPGIGQDLRTFAINAVYPGVYGLILVTGVLGLIVNIGLERLERSVLSWHASHRKGRTE